MFDPRTLPNGEFWPNLAFFVFYFAAVAELMAAAYAKWNKGVAVSDPTITNKLFDSTKSAGTVFINGIVRTVLFGVIITEAPKVHAFHAWVGFALAAPLFALAVKSLVAKKVVAAAK